MQVCGVPLAPDVTYFLDAAVEHGELDGLTHATLNLLGDRKTVMGIVDNDRPPKVRDGSCSPYLGIRGRGLAVRQGICYSLNSYARSIVAELDRPYQRAFVAQSLIEEKLRSRELAEVLASWNYEDSTVGGALERYRKGKDVRLRADGSPTPKVYRRLCSPSAIRRYVSGDPAQSLRHHANLAAGISTLPWPDHPAEAKLLESLFEVQEEARKVRRELAMKEFISKLDNGNRRRRMIQRENRKRLVKSAMMSDRLLGREPTRAFLRGEAVTVPATNDMVFQIKSERVGSLGAGAVKVSLAASKGERLANLCLYFDQTPPLDQLVAIALHAEAGNAGELVKTGNLYDVTEAGVSHPALKARAEALPRVVGDLQFVTRHMFGYDWARQDRLVKDYHRDYGAHYRRALEDVVWRAQAPRLRRFWALMEAPGLHVEDRK